ncbi:MAG: response regulator [Nitrospirota bacterium]
MSHGTESLKILIADDETLIAMSLTTMLQNIGHRVVARARSGQEAVEKAREFPPDLILMDIKMNDMDGLEASRRILAEKPVPIVILTAFSQKDLIEQADAIGVSGYLVKPVSENDLLPAITLARSRFVQLRALETEVGDLKEALRSRKLVEQAKGILMEKEGLTEAEAFKRIQQQSRNQNISMAKLAEAIITAGNLLSGKKG